MAAFVFGILTLFLKFSLCQRRITNGTIAGKAEDTSFVVYIVNSEGPWYPGWMCVGSLLTPNFILTAAACMTEIDSGLYAIAGYRIYVQPELIEFDNCTRHLRRKIRSFTAPPEYNGFDKTNWAPHDIAVARVFPQFDVFDKRYLQFCSYLPTFIGFSYENKYEIPDTDVVVYGWGHLQYYRIKDNTRDYNEEILQWARTKIVDKKICVDKYTKISSKLGTATSKAGICTDGKGNLDGNGTIINWDQASFAGCPYSKARRSGNMSEDEIENCEPDKPYDNSTSNASSNETYIFVNSRRNGICQNDHGAPLVTWVGGLPIVLGVGTGFLVKQNMQCTGPYLFASVAAHGEFIFCMFKQVLTIPPTPYRRRGSSGNEPFNCTQYYKVDVGKNLDSLKESEKR